MQSTVTTTGRPAVARGPWSALVEWLAIGLVCAATGAWPVPDVNETVYLTKARHAADPAWGRGDFFLETPDAHGVFFRIIGPLTAAVPLDSAAWIGRWAGWLAVAAGFRHAIQPLVTPVWARVVAAALFALALRQTTAAGEWVLGGCESKVFAWAAVLAAAGEWCRGRWPTAWAWAGGGTALHPLVGGWAQVALVVAGWWTGGPIVPPGARGRVVLWVAIGLGLAALGIVPVLSLASGVTAAEKVEATRIYVVERLPHHLLVRTFADGLVARHVLAVCVWWLLRQRLPATPARQRSDALTAAALFISLTGCAISLVEPFAPVWARGLLRYYWFRLGDGLVPFSLAATVAAALADAGVLAGLCRWPVPLVRWLAVGLLVADVAGQSAHWPLPGRRGLVARADTRVDAAAWGDVCRWVAGNTPADARFLTPRGASSFTWLTGRAEVVGWKNSPQDARSLIAWRRRIVDCYSRDGSLKGMVNSTAELGAEWTAAVAARYGADHAIVPTDVPGLDDFGWELLHRSGVYAVYRLPARPASPASAEP
jgi:hypothetical protein